MFCKRLLWQSDIGRMVAESLARVSEELARAVRALQGGARCGREGPIDLATVDTEAQIRKRLLESESVSFAILFGSRAPGGRPRPDSDWDVAVYLDERLGPEARFAARLRLATELSDIGRVDLVVLNDAPPLLAHRALQGGRRLFTRDARTYVRFFVRTLAASGDAAYWRSVQAPARRRRLEEGRYGRP